MNRFRRSAASSRCPFAGRGHWAGARRRDPRVDRVHRDPGDRRRAPQPGPVPGRRHRCRRLGRRSAGAAGARAGRRGRRGRQGQRRPGSPARVLRRSESGRLQLRRVPGAQDPGRPGRRDRAGRLGLAPVRRRAQRHDRFDRTGPHPGGARRRSHAGPGQQGVAHRGRAAGQGRRAAPRAARAGRLGALGAGAVPACRLGRRGPSPGADRERWAVPWPDAATS